MCMAGVPPLSRVGGCEDVLPNFVPGHWLVTDARIHDGPGQDSGVQPVLMLKARSGLGKAAACLLPSARTPVIPDCFSRGTDSARSSRGLANLLLGSVKLSLRKSLLTR